MSITLLDKWNVLQAIFADARLSQSAKVIAGVLLGKLNTGNLRCNPKVETLEPLCSLRRRSILAGLRELRATGWLQQKRRRGSSFYIFEFGANKEVRNAAPEEVHEMQKPAPHTDGEEVQKVAPPEEQKTAHVQAQKAAPLREYGNLEYRKENTGTHSLGDPSPKGERTPPSSFGRKRLGDYDADFPEWYAVYPRKVGKGGARKAYIAARGKGITQAVLIGGAQRYAAERGGNEPRYTKYPATWLNEECWADEPIPESTPTAPMTQGRPQRRGGSAVELVRAEMGDAE